MKRFYILILFTLGFVSCDELDIGCGCVDIDTHVEIAFKNLEGLDLLDPDNSVGYKESEIDIYNIVDGEKVKVYTPNLTYPEHFLIFHHEDLEKYFMRIFPTGGLIDGISASYINFGDGTEDKIEFEIEDCSNGETCTKVWYNEVLMWDKDTSTTYRRIDIIK